MAKTGESYAAARSGLLTRHASTVPDDSGLGWMAEALHISNGDSTDVPGTGPPPGQARVAQNSRNTAAPLAGSCSIHQ